MINGKKENVTNVISFFSLFPTDLFIIILIGMTLTSGGSAASHVFAATQPVTALPSCTDPTGQSLPCLMVISTLPPPPNAIQCQETSGQSLPCSYATQNLSSGEQVVVITVYIPTNYAFTGYGPWTVVKEVVHKTKTTIVHVIKCPKGQTLDPQTHKCIDVVQYCPPPKGYHLDSKTHKCVPDHCPPGQVYNPLAGKCEIGKCERFDADDKTDPDKNLKTIDCDINDANEHRTTPISSTTCNSPTSNSTCLPTNNTKTSGGSGAESTCVNNCTAGPPPAVDCTKNPTDPSCSQTLTPSTTTPTTKTCPDGSVIDSSATCPTQPGSPNPSSPNTQTPPPNENNPPSSGGDNGNNNPPNGGNENGKNDNSNDNGGGGQTSSTGSSK
jgi:hypothetical protein